MNHDGSRQYAFSYGLATTPQLHLQQQQHLQLQQQQHVQQQQQHVQQQQQQIIQQQYSQAIPQNVYQVQLAGNPGALLQQKESQQMALARGVHTGAAQHGLMSPPVVQANMPVSLDNKSIHSIGNLDAVMYPPQNNSLKILANSGSVIQQNDGIMGMHPTIIGVESLGKSNIFDQRTQNMENIQHQAIGLAGQGNMYTLGKQQYSGWMQHNDISGHHRSLGQNSLPSFGHVWSQFQQQKAQVNIVQHQQQQQINQYQPQQQQLQGRFQQQLNPLQTPQQQFTVSGMQSLPNIQMIKIQPDPLQEQAVIQSATLIQQPNNTLNSLQTATPIQNALSAQQSAALIQQLIDTKQTSSQLQNSLIPHNSISATLNQNCNTPKASAETVANVTSVGSIGFSTKNVLNKSTADSPETKMLDSQPLAASSPECSLSNSKLMSSPSQSSQYHSESGSPSLSSETKLETSKDISFLESGPPKVTVTLDTLTHCQTFPQFPEKPDSPIEAVTLEESIVECGKQCNRGRGNANKFQTQHKAGQANNKKTQNPLKPAAGKKRNEPTPKTLGKLKKVTSLSKPKPLLLTSSGSSVEHSSFESSNFSSPPFSFTPPSSIETAFTPSPVSKMSDVQIGMPSGANVSSSVLSSPGSSLSCSSYSPSSFTSSSTAFSPLQTSEIPPSTNTSKTVSSATEQHYLPPRQLSPCISSSNIACIASSSTHISSRCCSLALTTTSVTCSSPMTHCGMTVASCHSSTPLSSPSVMAPHKVMSNRNTATELLETELKSVKVPYSWQRKLENGYISYLSPSGALLTSLSEIRDYLLSDDTCKCGLECPIQLDKAFSFDPKVENQPWSASGDNLSNLCIHRREILALAAFHKGQAQVVQSAADAVSVTGRKREKKSLSSGDGLKVSPHKKLKTSITNAVNKHALNLNNSNVNNSSNSSLPVISSDVSHEKSQVISKDQEASGSSLSPAHLLSISSIGDISEHSRNSLASADSVDGPLSPTLTLDPFENNPLLPHLNYPESLSGQTFPLHHPNQSQALSMTGAESTPYSWTVSTATCNVSQVQPSPVSLTHQQPPSPNMFSDTPCSMSRQSQHQASGFHLTSWNDAVVTSAPSVIGVSGHNHLQSSSHSQNSQLTYSCSLRSQKFENCGSTKSVKNKVTKTKKEKPKSIPKTGSGIGLSKFLNKGANTAPPSTAVSFMENPTVYVAQQTAIINNSIASCQLDCSSPNRVDSECNNAIAHSEITTEVEGKQAGKWHESDFTDGTEEEMDISKEEDDHKGSTDVDSNKSFSDTTENNDSAYLSQTGSDQEKSDTVDGLDCLSKPSDIYDFNSSEDQVEKKSLQSPAKVLGSGCVSEVSEHDGKSESPSSITKFDMPDFGANSQSVVNSKNKDKKHTTAVEKLQKPKPKQKSKRKESQVPVTFDSSQEGTKCSIRPMTTDEGRTTSRSLNGDFSQLLASNNWNIPALQKVLAQHSAGDTAHLNAAVQQVLEQASNPKSVSATPAVKAVLKHGSDVINPSQTLVCSQQQNQNNASLSCSNDIPSTMPLPTGTWPKGAAISIKENQTVGSQSTNSSTCPNSVQGPPTISNNSLSSISQQTQCLKQVDAVQVEGNGKVDMDTKPLASTNSMLIIGTTQTANSSPQLTISVAPICASSMGTTTVSQCAPSGSTVLVNNLAPQMMPMSAPMPSVSVSIMTNVSKPLTQVIPTIGMNQTLLGNQQFINTQQNAAAQFVNATATPQGSHLVSATSQSTQLMNALSIQGLNNQLLIASSIPQASPSNSLAQLSPAIARQIIAQSPQPLQQMSPSFVSAQIQKPAVTSVIPNQNMVTTNAQIPTLTMNRSNGDVPSTISQTTIIGSTFQDTGNLNDASAKCIDNADLSNSNARSRAQNSQIANSSVYSTTNPPVFVIPRANAASMMHLLGSSQSLQQATGLQGEVGIQPNNIGQLLGQSNLADNQLQSLIAAGFNPLTVQQTWNTVNLGAQQQQQQQQLQLLQLQQLMLQQLQNQGQSLSGIAPNSNQPTALGTPAIMNTLVAQQSLQLNPMLDMKTLQQALSPVAQNYTGQAMSPAAQAFSNPIQQIPSPLAVHQIAPVTPNVSVTPGIHHPSVTNAPTSVAVQATVQNRVSPVPYQPTVSRLTASQKQVEKPQQDQPSSSLPASSTSKAATSSSGSKLSVPKTSKSKSKSKKSDNAKGKDPQNGKDEEKILTVVQQILAQAVQQQKELNLAAKNQPPPPPKSRSRKSREGQAKAKAAHCNKELELGKIASISDDVVVDKSHSLDTHSQTNLESSTSSSSSSLSQSSYLGAMGSSVQKSSQNKSKQTLLTSPIFSPTAIPTLPVCDGNGHQGEGLLQSGSNGFSHRSETDSHPISSNSVVDQDSSPQALQLSSPSPSGKSSLRSRFLEHTINEAASAVNPTKKYNISLKEHLSSIVSCKDKDKSGKKSDQLQGKQGKSTTSKSVVNGDTHAQPTKRSDGKKTSNSYSNKDKIAMANGATT